MAQCKNYTGPIDFFLIQNKIHTILTFFLCNIQWRVHQGGTGWQLPPEMSFATSVATPMHTLQSQIGTDVT